MTTQTEGVTTDMHRFVQAINRVLSYYVTCNPFNGRNPAEHDFLRLLDENEVKPWLQSSQMYPDDEIIDQFESQYLYLKLERKVIWVLNHHSSLIYQDGINIFDLLFRVDIAFAKESAPIGAYTDANTKMIILVYEDDSKKHKELLSKYLEQHPIDSLQDQVSRKIDF